MMDAMFDTATPQSMHMLQANLLGCDANGFQEELHPWSCQSPWALKSKASRDPDLPTIREALSGPYAEYFWKAMDKEITGL